mmetsp:Transcript_8692/g.23334  ORF Transcript_8692/g.23334 Transcript_8692/m.23334 type:complete len:615 (+) Transcript_8692:200-2044(+)|eukprot:CAMPEP_0202373262 /NCGR_PEP_ID=MMETSP1127-20130417/4313_1 /ASSEMBLY_ACC=CAM_ASM_000462 /TAXON_ID=3047 /ORGANISM="Dunaliella tertiolecta, Strain CCMP1320" /LENGTH=614 /DNA_ID=CAMNT_0048970083 /DNA_START=203 /DNA_END=2047 /DNA_ORIENTATION=-
MGHSHSPEQGPRDADQALHDVPERSLAAFTKAHFWEPLKKLEVSLENERLQKLEVERQHRLLQAKDPFHFVRRPSDQYAARFSTFKDLEKHIQMRWEEYAEAQRKLSEANPTSFEEAAALGQNCAKCWLDMVIRDHAASVIQAYWRRKTGRLLPNHEKSNRIGKPTFRKLSLGKEARLLGKRLKTTEQPETRNRAMRRSSTVTLDERPSPTLQPRGSTDRRSQQKALLDDRPSPEPHQLASGDRITPTSHQRPKGGALADHGAGGQGMPNARQMGRREDAETLPPGSPKKANKAASPGSSELRSSVLQQLSRSMHLKEGKAPMSGTSSTSGDSPSCSSPKPLPTQQRAPRASGSHLEDLLFTVLAEGRAPMSSTPSTSGDSPSCPLPTPFTAQQRAPRASGSRLEDLLFSSGLCTSQYQQQGHSRLSDGLKVDNLMLDGRPTFTRLGFEQNRLSRRSSPVTNGNTQPNHNILSSSQSFSSSSNNNSSSTGPGNPHNLRASILDHSCLPQRDSGSSHPRRHSLTSNLILSKTSLPARPSASGRLTSPAGAAMGSAHDVQQLPSNTSNVGREGLLLSTRGNGGLKPTGTKPAADGAPSRLGLLSSALPGGSEHTLR